MLQGELANYETLMQNGMAGENSNGMTREGDA